MSTQRRLRRFSATLPHIPFQEVELTTGLESGENTHFAFLDRVLPLKHMCVGG